jgi:hypothetical protein
VQQEELGKKRKREVDSTPYGKKEVVLPKSN